MTGREWLVAVALLAALLGGLFLAARERRAETPHIYLRTGQSWPTDNKGDIPTPPVRWTLLGTWEVTAHHSGTTGSGARTEPAWNLCAARGFTYGTTLYIEGVGVRTVMDVCRDEGVVDLFMASDEACRTWGRRSARVWELEAKE
jgi:3D (Asp-Asp-Asp) domain-containing protein